MAPTVVLKCTLALALLLLVGPLARACAVCHGQQGLAVTPETPHLAGQPERYLGEQLKAYRNGKRQHEVMAVIAKPLSDEDIRDLAAWFASLKVEVKEP